MPSSHDIHHTFHEFCHTYMAVYYIYIYIYIYVYVYLNLASIPKPLPIIQGQPSNQTTYCLVQPLAQAERFCLGESPPSPRRGLKTGTGNNAGSRLGETPLAWASCLLAQNNELAAWATFGEKGLDEPPPDSLRRVRLAWARLSVLAMVSPATDVSCNPANHTKHLTYQEQWLFHTNNSQAQEQA